jgi:hypothetical protein
MPRGRWAEEYRGRKIATKQTATILQQDKNLGEFIQKLNSRNIKTRIARLVYPLSRQIIRQLKAE